MQPLLWSGEMGFHQPLGRWPGAGKPGLGPYGSIPCRDGKQEVYPIPASPQHEDEVWLGQDATLELFVSHVLGSITK